MLNLRVDLSNATSGQRTETSVDLSNVATGERTKTPPPTYENISSLPTYDEVCNIPGAQNTQSVVANLTHQVTDTFRETYSNIFTFFANSFFHSSTTSQPDSTQSTVQEPQASSNHVHSNPIPSNGSQQITERLGSLSVQQARENVEALYNSACDTVLTRIYVNPTSDSNNIDSANPQEGQEHQVQARNRIECDRNIVIDNLLNEQELRKNQRKN